MQFATNSPLGAGRDWRGWRKRITPENQFAAEPQLASAPGFYPSLIRLLGANQNWPEEFRHTAPQSGEVQSSRRGNAEFVPVVHVGV